MYRSRGITKRVGGKVKRYKNLASFRKECLGRSGNICHLKSIRCLRDGGGLATVRSNHPGDPGIFHRGAKPAGTWLLHFASCAIMKKTLRDKVSVKPREADLLLRGARRKRKPLTAAQLRDKLACKVFGGKACP